MTAAYQEDARREHLSLRNPDAHFSLLGLSHKTLRCPAAGGEVMARAHVVMPDDLIAEVDRLVGQRERSRFVTEAVRAKLARERLKQVAAELGGSLADVPIPGWETSESAAEWVHSLRRSGDRRDWSQPVGDQED